MATKQGAKLKKPVRAKKALSGGLTAEELFDDLAAAYRRSRGQAKVDLGLQLAPYLKAKLKAVDITQTANVKVNITIGGTDGDDTG